ncbi:MAG: Sua5/YciO/YrdC/YwlC family protein [Pirellulales bacterium]
MPSTLDWKSSEDTRDIVHLVVQALVEGRKVALPFENAYHSVYSGLNGDSVEHLAKLRSAGRAAQTCLLLRSSQELLDYVPELSAVAARVAARAWPGPLIIDLAVEQSKSLLGRLPESVQKLVNVDGRVAFRVASHETVRQALRLMPGPLVAAQLMHREASVRTIDGIDHSSGFSIVVDDGQTQYDDPATSVRIDGNSCQLDCKGAFQQDALVRAAQFLILIVCTGNTCRSPMAEALMRSKFEKRFGTEKEASRRVYVASAGLNAFPGGPASIEAQATMAQRGLSLVEHQSRSVTTHALNTADLILTMTRSHRNGILEQMPEISGKVKLVSGSSSDVSDPFGGPQPVYAACADQIDAYLDKWLDQLDDSLFPNWK